MLDFIVLGLVPGTNLQLAFEDVMRLIVLVVLLVVVSWEAYRYKHRKVSIANRIDQIAL